MVPISFRMFIFSVEKTADAVAPASSRDETKTKISSIRLIGSVVDRLGETCL